MRVISLGSGSSGNALLIEAGPRGRTKLLIDAGFNGRVLAQRLRQAGVTPAQLTGILVTHEHIDHVLGLPYMMKYYRLPVITNPLTISALQRIFAGETARSDSGTLVPLEMETDALNGTQAAQLFRALPSETSVLSGDIEVISFPVSHDAAAPCGFLLSAGGCRVCVVIDTGEVTATMLAMMQHADLLILESNHDRERLLRGPYPYPLKQRILSATGHLSNDQAAEAFLRTWRGDAVRWVWLSHLSRTNNTPRLALNTMRARMSEAGANLAQAHITALPPHLGGVWDSTQLWQNTSLWEIQG
ncbi:MAG TPA: MBL fold metallo-hydrolase [Ktedonobacteraceae bacterium]|nr:MBL fold metallo-hydrolase [Ktedonobacteraceae bacterium]